MMPHMASLPMHGAQPGFHSPHPGGAPPGMTAMVLGPNGLVPLSSIPPHLRPPMPGQHHGRPGPGPGMIPVQILPNGQQIPLVGLPPGMQLPGMGSLQAVHGYPGTPGPNGHGVMAQGGAQVVMEQQQHGHVSPPGAVNGTPTPTNGGKKNKTPRGRQISLHNQPPAPVVAPPAPGPQLVAPAPQNPAVPVTDLDKLRRLKADIEAGVHPIYKPLSEAEQAEQKERREREAREAEEKQKEALEQEAAALARSKSDEGEAKALNEEIERKIALATKSGAPDEIDVAIGRATQRIVEGLAAKGPVAAPRPPGPAAALDASDPPPLASTPQRASFRPGSYPTTSQSSPPIGGPPVNYDRQPPQPTAHELPPKPIHYSRPESPPPFHREPRRPRSPSPPPGTYDRPAKTRRYDIEHHEPLRGAPGDWRYQEEIENDRRRYEQQQQQQQRRIGSGPTTWDRERDREIAPQPRHRVVDPYARDPYQERRDEFGRQHPEEYQRRGRAPSDVERYDYRAAEARRISVPPVRRRSRSRSPGYDPAHPARHYQPHQSFQPYQPYQPQEDPRAHRSEVADRRSEDDEWTEEERRQYEEEKRRYEEEKARYYRELEEYERKKAARAAEKRARQLAEHYQQQNRSHEDIDGVPVVPTYDLDGDALMRGGGEAGGHARKMSSGSHSRPSAISIIDAAEGLPSAGSSVASGTRASYERPYPPPTA